MNDFNLLYLLLPAAAVIAAFVGSRSADDQPRLRLLLLGSGGLMVVFAIVLIVEMISS